MRRQAWGLATLAWVLAPAGMAAAQVCVNPAGGGCQTTIQAGVDVATAGQTITVAPGSYSETVEIPPGKDGLVLNASGAVLDNPTADNGILVLSNDVTIRGLALRNGYEGIMVGDGTLVYPSGTVLTKLSFNGSSGSCIFLNGADDTTISASSFTSCAPFAVGAYEGDDSEGADGVTVSKNRFRICGDGCVYIPGDDAAVSANKIAQSEDGQGVSVSGSNAVVEKNTMTAVSGGVYVIGAHPTVVKNKVSVYSSGNAFDIACTSGCTGAVVASNKASNGIDDEGGFTIYSLESGLLVSKNSSTTSADDGFDISGVGVVVTGNKAISSGGDNYEHGFSIYGADHVVTGNTASGSADDGFYIQGQGIHLTGNTASGNFGDGFDCEDDGTDLVGIVLTSNIASGNTGEGFDLFSESANPIDVTLTGNTAVGNRVPFCTDVLAGTPADGGGNSFVVAGAPACEVDH